MLLRYASVWTFILEGGFLCRGRGHDIFGHGQGEHFYIIINSYHHYYIYISFIYHIYSQQFPTPETINPSWKRLLSRNASRVIHYMQTTITTPLLHILIHTPKRTHLRLHFSPSLQHMFMSVSTTTPSVRIVLSVYAQHTVCQPIQFYRHYCRSNYPPILYKRDIGKQSDKILLWLAGEPCYFQPVPRGCSAGFIPTKGGGSCVLGPPLFQIFRPKVGKIYILRLNRDHLQKNATPSFYASKIWTCQVDLLRMSMP